MAAGQGMGRQPAGKGGQASVGGDTSESGPVVPVTGRRPDPSRVVTSMVVLPFGSMPKVVESVADTPAHALAQCPDGLQPIEQSRALGLGQHHDGLQGLFEHPDQSVMIGSVIQPNFAAKANGLLTIVHAQLGHALRQTGGFLVVGNGLFGLAME